MKAIVTTPEEDLEISELMAIKRTIGGHPPVGDKFTLSNGAVWESFGPSDGVPAYGFKTVTL